MFYLPHFPCRDVIADVILFQILKKIIKELRNKDERICYVDFSRNFGKEIAMQLLPFISWGDFSGILEKIKVEACQFGDSN